MECISIWSDLSILEASNFGAWKICPCKSTATVKTANSWTSELAAWFASSRITDGGDITLLKGWNSMQV